MYSFSVLFPTTRDMQIIINYKLALSYPNKFSYPKIEKYKGGRITKGLLYT